MENSTCPSDASTMSAEKKIKRTFKLMTVVDGAKKEFAEGMGIGVLNSHEVTFELTQSKYDSPIFAASLLMQQELLRDEVIKMRFEEVTPDTSST